MNPFRWITRHLFFLLALLAAAALSAVTWSAGRMVSLESQPVMVEGDEPPLGLCGSGPFYDLQGRAHERSLPYSGPAPLYILPAEALGLSAADCDFPETVTPTLVTQAGLPHFPVSIEAVTPGEWMRLGESTTLEAAVSIEEAFSGAGPLDREAVRWTSGETRQVSFSVAAPNFDFSPSNDEIQPQPLSLGRQARQLWIIAPRSGVSGGQVISIKLDDPASGLPVTFAYVWLTVRHPTGLDPILVTLIAAVGLAVGWVLDRIKTLYEIRKMVENESAYRAPRPPAASPERPATPPEHVDIDGPTRPQKPDG